LIVWAAESFGSRRSEARSGYWLCECPVRGDGLAASAGVGPADACAVIACG
jgi:hypothetical protein